MARGRLISKSLGSSRKFHAVLKAGGKLGEFCQVLYPLLIANTDDYGRLPGDAFTVKHVVLPSSKRPDRDFDAALDALATVGLIERYQVDGAIYLQINNFDAHQPNLHKRPKARFPESPGSSGNFRGISGKSALTQNPEPGTQNSEPRTQNPEPGNPEPSSGRASDSFPIFWDAYPKRKAKKAAQRAWSKIDPNSELLAVILRALARQQDSPDWQKESGRYIPLPATWLNDARWTDELPEERAACAAMSPQGQHNVAVFQRVTALYQQRGGRDP